MTTTALAYVRLPHFVPAAMVVAATGALAWVIEGSSLTAGELTRLMLAMLGGQIVVGVVNELIDAETDALTKPSKPIPAGLVSRRGAAYMAGAGAVLMVVAGATFGLEAFLLLVLGTGTGVAYSLWFKRSRFAWLPYLVALPLLPVWVAVAFNRFEPALLLLYPLGAFAVLGLQIAQSLPDIEADRAAGIDSLTTRLGERRAILLCWASVFGSLVLAFIAALVRDEWSRTAWLAALAIVAMIALDIFLYIWKPRTGVMAAFPCVAASAAILAIAWVAGIYR